MAQDLGTGYILIQPSTKGLGKAIEDPLASAVQSASKSGGKTILSRIGGAFTSVGKVGLAAIGTIGGNVAAHEEPQPDESELVWHDHIDDEESEETEDD